MKESLKSMRANPLYIRSLILHGNNKLKDYDDVESLLSYRYAQYNTRAIKDCPFRSAGCEAVCYATKGNHVFPSVQESRERSYEESRRDDFSEAIAYTIRTEKKSKRYADAVMLIRLHESGDFYSLQYMRKWVKAWNILEHDSGWQTTFYTKCFVFLLMLTDEEADVINRLMRAGKIAMNLSVDDTTTPEQIDAMLKVIARYPMANIYRCTEDVDSVEHDNVCDCADCAKCGTCNKGTGKTTVVKIHSASNDDMKVYRANVNK